MSNELRIRKTGHTMNKLGTGAKAQLRIDFQKKLKKVL